MNLLLNAALVCWAALALRCPAVSSRREEPPLEAPGRSFRPDRHREAYESRVADIYRTGLVPRTYELPVDSRMSAVKKWYNFTSDQVPISLAASTTGAWIYILRSSIRSIPARREMSLLAGSADLLKMDVASGTLSSRSPCGLLGNPQRLAVDADENLWIADRESAEVVKLSMGSGGDLSSLLAVGTLGRPADRQRPRFCLPSDVAVSSSGYVFVADSAAPSDTWRRECTRANGLLQPSRVVRFTSDGAYAGHFDLESSVFMRISLDERRDQLFVADLDNSRLYAYGAGLRPSRDRSFGSLLGQVALDVKINDVRVHPTEDLLYATMPRNRLIFGLTLNVTRLGDMFVQGRWQPPSQAYGFYSVAGLVVDRNGSALYAADDDGAQTNVWKFTIA